MATSKRTNTLKNAVESKENSCTVIRINYDDINNEKAYHDAIKNARIELNKSRNINETLIIHAKDDYGFEMYTEINKKTLYVIHVEVYNKSGLKSSAKVITDEEYEKNPNSVYVPHKRTNYTSDKSINKTYIPASNIQGHIGLLGNILIHTNSRIYAEAIRFRNIEEFIKVYGDSSDFPNSMHSICGCWKESSQKGDSNVLVRHID